MGFLGNLLNDAIRVMPGHQQPRPTNVPQMASPQAAQQSPLYLGHAQNIESYTPQDGSIDPSQGADNFLQPSYNNPQTTVHSMFQQPVGTPMSQSVRSPGGSTAADPGGWNNELSQRLRMLLGR